MMMSPWNSRCMSMKEGDVVIEEGVASVLDRMSLLMSDHDQKSVSCEKKERMDNEWRMKWRSSIRCNIKRP